MFTGLIEEIGIIKSLRSQSNNLLITVQANKVMDQLKIDDSVSVNGVCQTVVKISDMTFDVVAVQETLSKTTFRDFTISRKVNLERALRLGDRLGGHIVQGHVDSIGTVSRIDSSEGSKQIWIEFPIQFSQYVVPIGSICIDGVSLTVARVEGNKLMVAVIPHTLDVTILRSLTSGNKVNLEFDILGKYIEKMFLKHTLPTDKHSILNSWITQPDI